MEILPNLLLGLSVVFSLENLIYLVVGALVGMVVGVLPGLGPAAGIALLLPLTFSMKPVSAVVMLAAIYYGSMYGGTITSIVLNIPGEAASVPACLDGYPLAQQGRAGPALVMQAIASFIGGTLGVVLLGWFAPLFTRVARSFGPSEFFMVIVMGLLMLVTMLGENKRYGVISALLGFALATVGVDIGTGHPRFTFGVPDLLNGVDFVPIAIGLFGLSEVFHSIYHGFHASHLGAVRLSGLAGEFWPRLQDWVESRFAILRGSLLGFVVGVIPGAGATIASLMAYSVEKGISKHPERFGKGYMPGLAAPEAANNAATAGAMVPLLSLGIPGSAATAILLAGFLMWGLRPGPLLMTQEPEFAWGLIASMYLGNVVLVLLSIFAIPAFTALLRVPYRILAPVIVVVSVIGTFSVNGSMADVWLMVAAGVVGFFMKGLGFSPGATVVALVLGPRAEETLRQALLISGGSLSIFVERPVTLALGILAVVVAAGPALARLARSVARSGQGSVTVSPGKEAGR